MDLRKYDKKLVDAIREKEYVKIEDGIEVTYKPIPDDDRNGVLDPRLRNTILMKKKMFADKKARNCFACKAQDTCNWEMEKRTMNIEW